MPMHRLRVVAMAGLSALAGQPPLAQPGRYRDGAPSPAGCEALGFRPDPRQRDYGGVTLSAQRARPASVAPAPSTPPLPLPPVQPRVERRIEEPRPPMIAPPPPPPSAQGSV